MQLKLNSTILEGGCFMKKSYKILMLLGLFTLCCATLCADTFNEKLTKEDRAKLDKGEVLIKNIDYQKYMCLNPDENAVCKQIVTGVKNLNPKYLAEIIQKKDYKGNEKLPDKIEALLKNIPDYAGIPYYSERHKKYFDLYSSAKIVSETKNGNTTTIKAELDMEPFGIVKEDITIEKHDDYLLYTAVNTNDLKYDGFTCVGKGKLKVYIYLYKKDNKWIIYGIGGVNAPHFPFLTDRIRTSFINRIKTFCNFIFTKL